MARDRRIFAARLEQEDDKRDYHERDRPEHQAGAPASCKERNDNRSEEERYAWRRGRITCHPLFYDRLYGKATRHEDHSDEARYLWRLKYLSPTVVTTD